MTSDQPRHDPPRILLVDDDALLQELLAMHLEYGGYAVSTAGNGREAMDRLATETPDLIMLDMMMPVMDGLQFLRWLRQEQHSAIPVLALTGMQKPGGDALILDTGANAVLYKPVDHRRLLASIENLLN
ncbi:MAG: response regulator transcription factor [Candidatus Competibacterales bacterium]|nr:response regulator transcription factor [Candidatus Competibacterales bacterium]